MTPEQLVAIRARAEAATPGPWTVDEGFVAEILRYVLCCPDVRRVGEAVQQLRIYLGDGV